jgi:hypothetical protein
VSISLATANVISAWAYPVIFVGVLLTSVGTIALFYAGVARTHRPATETQAAVDSGKRGGAKPLLLLDSLESPKVAVDSADASGQQAAAAQLRPSIAIPRQGEAVASDTRGAEAKPLAIEAPPAAGEPNPPAGAEAKPAADQRGWRSLTLRQQAGMRAVLSGAPGVVWFMTEEDPEAQHYADELAKVFRQSGWTERRSLIPTKGGLSGLSVAYDVAVPDWAIRRAFNVAGVPISPRQRAGDEPAPAIYVGARAARP